MEESEKRRERLKSMRMEAAQAGVYNDVESPTVSHGLSNPLIETSATPQAERRSTPRFDYYTDPMSAFSANRRSKVSHQILQDHFTPPRPRNPEMTPPPVHHAQTDYSPDQRMFQTHNHSSGTYKSPIGMASPENYHSSGAYRSPIGMASPENSHSSYRSPIPMASPENYHSYGNYRGMASPSGMLQGNPPAVWNGSGRTSSYIFPSNSSRGVNFSSPGFGQGGSPGFNSGQGRGHWFNSSPGPGSGYGGSRGRNLGRGRGRWLGGSMSPGSGWSGGRRSRSHDHVSAEVRPALYYDKSMVEDPWKFLEPVIWRENVLVTSSNTPDTLKSWLPKSVRQKKARVLEASKGSSSQPSLAEYLAASFNEAVDNEAVNDAPSV